MCFVQGVSILPNTETDKSWLHGKVERNESPSAHQMQMLPIAPALSSSHQITVMLKNMLFARSPITRSLYKIGKVESERTTMYAPFFSK